MRRGEDTGTAGAPAENPRLEGCLTALDRVRDRLGRRGPIDIRLVRLAVGEVIPRRVFDECLLRLEREGALSLTPHARPETLDALGLRDCVPSPRGPLGPVHIECG